MAKSRIKSEEEYNQILGVSSVSSSIQEKEEKTTHDASQYFDELRGAQNEKGNPFDRVVSVERIKEKLKSSDNAQNVEKIKEQIASAQREVPNDIITDSIEETIVRPTKHTIDSKREFSFEENARKLYENLRGDTLKAHAPMPIVVPEKEIEVVEPISISVDRVNEFDNKQEVVFPEVVEQVVVEPKSEDVIPTTESLEDSLMQLQQEKPNDNLELTADFTLENENFIDAINQSKKEPVEEIIEDIFIEEALPEETPKKAQEELAEDVDFDFTGQLNEQMDIIEGKEDIEDQEAMPIVEEDIFIEEPVDQEELNNGELGKELEGLTKHKPREDLGKTLTLALNQNDSVSFPANDMKALKNEDVDVEEAGGKRKVGDIIITIALIIMICVVIFLLVQTFVLN